MSQTDSVSIKLPVLRGYEYTGEFRTPFCDEYFLDNRSDPASILKQSSDGRQFSNAYHIVRELWQPKREDLCLKPGWIAMDANGQWWWYSTEPSPNSGILSWESKESEVALSPLAFDLPKEINWLHSLRKI